MPKIAKYLLIAVLVLVVVVPAGTYAYIHYGRDDTPQRFSFDTTTSTTAAGSPTSTTTVPTLLDGSWTAINTSQVGYRVKERLLGQDTEAVGRTNAVTGSLTYASKRITDANFTVDMTTVKSDQGNRDNQFRGRIMNTAKYPTASFKLTKPIDLPIDPSPTPVSVKAVGDLTLRGTTKSVTLDMQMRTNADHVETNGSVPISFSAWDIPNPSIGPAETADNGELELLLVFAKQ